MECFQIGKGVRQGCILSPGLFNFCAEYIMQNAELDDSGRSQDCQEKYQQPQTRDDTTLMAGTEEFKRLLMRVKEESEEVGLNLNIQKMKIMASGPISSWEIDGETVETVSDFILGGLQNHYRWWLQPWN